MAGARSALIGRVSIGEHALRLPGPGDGPPCKVLELPIELMTSSAAKTPTRHGKHTHSDAQNRGDDRQIPGAITLFLERILPPSPVRLRSDEDLLVSSTRQEPTAVVAATTVEATATPEAHDGTTSATAVAAIPATGSSTDNDHEDIGKTVTTNPSAPVARTQGSGGSNRQPRGPPPPGRPPAREKMQLKVSQAWGLSSRARAMDVVVAVMACGRSVGTTRVASVGGTTSPEWIDEK